MPHYNIWIRESDDSKWQAIDNRSAWLHERLNNTVYKDKQYELKISNTKFVKAKDTTIISPKRLDNGVCKKHGTPLDDRGRCLQKGH